jgi:hypothetical protein
MHRSMHARNMYNTTACVSTLRVHGYMQACVCGGGGDKSAGVWLLPRRHLCTCSELTDSMMYPAHSQYTAVGSDIAGCATLLIMLLVLRLVLCSAIQ